VLPVVSVSEPRADSGQSSLVCVYIETRLPDDTGPHQQQIRGTDAGVVSYPWIHESETAAAHAEHDAGDLLGEEGRRFQRRVEAALEADPDFRAWRTPGTWSGGAPSARTRKQTRRRQDHDRAR
jgi:hypothetical protein